MVGARSTSPDYQGGYVRLVAKVGIETQSPGEKGAGGVSILLF